MRTNEERIAAMHKRAAELEKEKRQHRTAIIQAVSITACFAAVIALAVFMPGFSRAFVSEENQGSMSASIFSGSSLLGYIVIGTIAFFLGVSVTIFCFWLKKWQEREERQVGAVDVQEERAEAAGLKKAKDPGDDL